ncbi:hypothetical protein C0J52_10034 [Blattella germanica]|nr:hypothetical protein C0J52_10034 [Blattella germanica]
MPKRKSIVWDHFDETEKGKKAKCAYCPQFISISGGSLSNLARHIRKKHPSLLIFNTAPDDVIDFDRYSQEFLTELIELYKTHECLWNPESKEFSDSHQRAIAFETLLGKFKEVDPKSNRDTVIRILSYMRSCYRKELRKIKEFSQTATEDAVFTSELWYFNLFGFLQPLEMQNDSSTSVDSVYEESDSTQPQDLISMISDMEDCNKPGSPSFGKRRPTTLIQKKPEFHSVQGQGVHGAVLCDKFDFLSKGWAMTMKSLNREQQIFAEKLISDILYEAQLGSLSRDSALCTRIKV